MSDECKAVFLSYASQDAGAAKQICDSLRQAGIEVWFDQSELHGGDAWDQKIRKQIRDCTLFVPVISANTQARLEGYFRREWRMAVERMHDMDDDMPFLVPIVIDDTPDAAARVPERFRERQWTRLPGGEASNAFVDRIQLLLAGGDAPRVAVTSERTRPSPTRAPSGVAGPRRRLTVSSIIGIGIVLVMLVVVVLAMWPSGAQQDWSTFGRSPAASGSEARQLVARARAITNPGHHSRESLQAAEKLVQQAMAKDPTDGEIWAAAAEIDAWFVFYGYDRSEVRKQQARTNATNALTFAPESFEARLAQAWVLTTVVGSPAVRPEAEQTLRALLAERPADARVADRLGLLLRDDGRPEEAAGYFQRANNPAGAAWTYYEAGDAAKAFTAITEALKSDRSSSTLLLKAILELQIHEDLDAAQQAIEQIPPSARLEETVASMELWIAVFRRDPERILQLLRNLPQDYLSSGAFRGPTAIFAGMAHQLAGRHEAARTQWQQARDVVAARLQTQPRDVTLLRWKALLHVHLGERSESERTLLLSQELAGLKANEVTDDTAAIFAALGKHDELLAWLAAEFAQRGPRWQRNHSIVRFNPAFDPLRTDPRFQRLLADHLPKGAKPLEGQTTEDGR